MKKSIGIVHLILEIGLAKAFFLLLLMTIGSSAIGQDIVQFKMELSTNDYFHGRKIRKKPRSFSELRQELDIKLLYGSKDSVEAVVNITRVDYHVLEDELRGSLPQTVRFDSNRPEEGSRLIGKYVLPIVNEPFKLFYNKNGELLNEKDVYGSDPAKEFELEMETGSFNSRLSSMMLYPKLEIAEALGTMVKLRGLEQLHELDTLILSSDLQEKRIDTSYVQFARKGLPFLQKVESDTLNFSFDFKLLKDEDKISVNTRGGLDLSLERKTENIMQTTIFIQTDIVEMIWHTQQTQRVNLNPELWTTQWDLDQTFTVSGEFNSKSVRTRRQSFLVVE